MMLSEHDSGRIINMDVGDVFTVQLTENPTTGYRWTIESSIGLEEIENHFEGGRAIGAEGEHAFQFRTTQIGSYELRMKNWREWEGESSTLTHFIVKIIVK